jgi:hypothetical protein
MQGDEDIRPTVPLDDEEEELAERCADDRESLTPKETASCAGIDIVRQYENEEDGGS